MKKYVKPQDLTIKETEDQFTLNKGALHRYSISIDKIESSKEFVSVFSEFSKSKEITLEDSSSIAQDFNKLAQLNLIHTELSKAKDYYFVIDDSACSFFERYLDKKINIVPLSRFLNGNEINRLIEEVDLLELNKIKLKYSEVLKDKQLFLIVPYDKINIIKATNKLTKLIDKRYTLSFFDNENLFFTCIKHGETGCYECLEHQLISKFEGKISDYFGEEYSKEQFDISMYAFILSIVKNEIKNIDLYGDTTLLGNVLHFYLPTYESEFNFNKRQSSCTTCATVSNILFAEQNMKSANILKEVLSE